MKPANWISGGTPVAERQPLRCYPFALHERLLADNVNAHRSWTPG
jgi:hypothetical protein